MQEKESWFACRQCGMCCRWPGYVYLTDHDIARLARALALGEEEFIGRYTRLGPNRRRLCLTEQDNGACIFLAGASCLHYPDRPGQCREYPFGWAPPEGCAGMDKGA